VGDVSFGYVHEFEQAQDWWATRGQGAFRDGDRLATSGADELELLALENTHPARVAAAGDALEATGAHRLRALGSVAISLCHVASGGCDAMLTLSETRSVDLAAGQLLVREAGGVVALPDAGDLGAPLGLDMRSRVLAAATAESLTRLRTSFP
jgi:myo-inositol-1(or 4)-monophosphatase